MASPAAASLPALLLLAVALVALNAEGASAANFFVTNQCPFPVWLGAIPTGGGTQLNPGQTWLVPVRAGTTGGRIWGRTGCYFVGDHGGCSTGDCAGARSCVLSGKPPATLAEFSIGSVDAGAQDFYDVSVVDGFNVPMDFKCVTGGGDPIRCRDPGCADASHPGDAKVRTCRGNSDYEVTFCSA
ncbi:Thaumatin-like protein [Dichanthelium oligosanthes]|uniref:Thaumatin-like protein n=1 Tax=Dichanthelium oligosanthes TaxID=888268 RepID=A0A1E5UTX6_9POAL|nr:Thaumatin-like protein [Dichanthelium oligosanthes]